MTPNLVSRPIRSDAGPSGLGVISGPTKGRVAKGRSGQAKTTKARPKSAPKRTATRKRSPRSSAKSGKKKRYEDEGDSDEASDKFKKAEEAMEKMFQENDETGGVDLSVIRHIGFGEEGGEDDEGVGRGTDFEEEEEDEEDKVREEHVDLAALARMEKLKKRIKETNYDCLDDLTLMEDRNRTRNSGGGSGVREGGEDEGRVNKRTNGDGNSDVGEYFDGDALTDSQIV